MVSEVEPAFEAQAFAATAVTAYGAQLHGYLRRRVRRAEDLDDLAQEVYLRLLRVNRAETVRNPLAYIYGVAAHVVSEFNMRGRKARVLFDSPVAEAGLEARAQADGAGAARPGSYLERHINDALQQLPATQLAVLVLERRDGLTHVEIAAKLGLSVHTVKKYAVQALAHVRASLAE